MNTSDVNISHTKFIAFLLNLGYTQETIQQNLKENTFFYHKAISTSKPYKNDFYLKYIYIPVDNLNKLFFEKHTNLWNENNDPVFIAVSDDNTYIINTKVKPNFDIPLHKNITIANFSYGINSQGYSPTELKKLKQTVGKQSIDSAYFFNFIIEKTKRQKTSAVDKDLLLNLIQLRNDLLKIHKAEKVIHLLILRCLFIKYLEDRGIFEKNYLLNILTTGSVQNLIAAFEQIKRINGDIFKYDQFSVNDVDERYLKKLALFFSSFDYRSGQGTFFPYKFNKIPIQLISHVYEAFLSNTYKGNRGIYYTPTFVVKFMLAHTVQLQLNKNKNITILDPACGSGAFLVESFKAIIKHHQAEQDYKKKIEILQTQIFGIDIDEQALQIATFSLYLALLENEDPTAIQEKIKNAYPILPSLINYTLIKANSLVDNVFDDKTFDCIVANPPWGKAENKRTKEAIGKKDEIGELSQQKMSFPEYTNVSAYQRSQAFLLRVNKWCHANTQSTLIVNSPIFLNEKAESFRKELLSLYRITHFYELSHLNKILFKKTTIGKTVVNGVEKDVEIGASEPCVVIIFDKKNTENNTIEYISPQLTNLSLAFNLIHYTQKDIKTVKQADLQKEDYWLWRVFVNGSWDDYQLIKKKYVEKDNINISCRSGFKPKQGGERKGEPNNRTLIVPNDFEQYYIKKILGFFNWNVDLERDRETNNPNIFKEKRLLIPIRPLKSDKLKLRGIQVDQEIIHKHNISCIKVTKNNIPINNYAPYLAILNSAFMGYYTYHISAQWGKGGEKRSALRNSDIEKLPFPEVNESDERIQTLTKLVHQIESNKAEGKNTQLLQKQIDELVFDLYGLLDFEKEIIREFYQVNVEKAGELVETSDLQNYLDKFRQVFSFILADHLALNASYRISANFGAFIHFSIVEKSQVVSTLQKSQIEDTELLYLIKEKQLDQTLFSNRLNEDKVKVYTNDSFFIIKSNYFKDWTLRQATIDANEEIGLIMKELPTE